MELAFSILQWMAVVFVFVVGLGALWVVVLFVADVCQTSNAIRRNFPVIGRFRYLFTKLGEFFRQYFFGMDREELPFNRAERTWVNRASEGGDTTSPFGSTRDIRPTGSVLFVNCPFPTLNEDAVPLGPVTIGPHCKIPYTTTSIFNISGMSYGAISRPAVLALSHGACKAGIWLNTGEGAISSYHLEGGADIVFQIGTAKYGVRDQNGRLDDKRLRETAALETVRMFELKRGSANTCLINAPVADLVGGKAQRA